MTMSVQKEMDDTSSEASAASAWSATTYSTIESPPSALIAHHKLLVDALSKEKVTSQTTLAALYDFSDSNIDNTLLKNLTRISEPAVRCAVVTEDGKRYPPTGFRGTRYDLLLRFNKLLFAPCVRLECRFAEHTLALEFHFNKCESKQLFDFTWISDGHDLITFKAANGATCQGFNNVASTISNLKYEQKAIHSVLRGLVDSNDTNMLKFHLEVSGLGTESLRQLRQLQDLLPGGSEPTLPSIGVREYSCFSKEETIIQKPFLQMAQNHPPPMVPLPGSDTFSSLEEFSIQHRVATVMQDWEHQISLLQFAKGRHEIALYWVKPFAVIAMNFDGEPEFGNKFKTSKFRLPNELEVDIKFHDAENQETYFCKAHLETQPMGLKKHDAFFIVADKKFQRLTNTPTNKSPKYYRVTELRPHQNSFLLKSQFETIQKLHAPSYQPWRPIILNQAHDSINPVDVTAGIDVAPEIKKGAEEWLRECKPWNKKQLKVLDSIHHAKGRLSLCSGIAGTGKTTLQIALAIFSVKLGGRALITGTANTNADLIVKAITEFKEVIEEKKLRVYRIYSGSKKIPLEDMIANNVAKPTVGHRGGHAGNLQTAQFEMRTKKKKVGALECSLDQGVLDEIDIGELQSTRRVKWRGLPSEK